MRILALMILGIFLNIHASVAVASGPPTGCDYVIDGSSDYSNYRGYQLEVILDTDKGGYTHITRVSNSLQPRLLRDLKEDPRAIEPYMLTARKCVAERVGYTFAQYGVDHYRMLNIEGFNWIFRDKGNGTILAQKNNPRPRPHDDKTKK